MTFSQAISPGRLRLAGGLYAAAGLMGVVAWLHIRGAGAVTFLCGAAAEPHCWACYAAPMLALAGVAVLLAPAFDGSRMWTRVRGAGLASTLVVMASGLAVAAPAPPLHGLMKGLVAPSSATLWDLASKAFDDKGDPDASKLTAAQWVQIAEAAQALEAASGQMNQAQPILVAAPGVKIQDEGTEGASTAAQVQGFIDKDPEAFKAFARALAANAAEFGGAAKARDAAKLSAASDALDAVCEACHLQFWYPQQSSAAR